MRRLDVLITLVITCAACAGDDSGRAFGYVSQSDLGAAWPLTVTEGVLACDGSALIIKAGGVTYAVNGTAKSRGFSPIEPIWKTAPAIPVAAVAERIEPSRRREIFAGLAACDRKAVDDAIAKYPNDTTAQIGYERKLAAACRAELRSRHKVTREEERLIAMEGASLSWPPLSPTRVSIGPLIERGLALCK